MIETLTGNEFAGLTAAAAEQEEALSLYDVASLGATSMEADYGKFADDHD